MAVLQQKLSELYAIYNGDSCEVLPGLEESSVGFVLYSPPFADLYNYSSSERDLSNCQDYEQFLEHYNFIVVQSARVTKPGRINCVHCCDIPIPGQRKGYRDFPGDIIRLHQEAGFFYEGRISIWKEPFRVAMRTRLQHLTHKNIAKDSAACFPAGGDFILLFKRHGENREPIAHPTGIINYAGENEVPKTFNIGTHESPVFVPASYFHDFKGGQQKNRLSHWIWRQYASCFWHDVRLDRVLPYKQAKGSEEEKHVCPLQLDVIERCLTLWSNPGDVVLTPFMGVGSEVYMAVKMGRKAIGIELKESYYRQAVKNIEAAATNKAEEQGFDFADPVEEFIREAFPDFDLHREDRQ